MCWQGNGEASARAGSAFHQNAPVMGFYDFLTLKHPNTQAFGLRRTKRPEQLIFDEIRGHAATLVGDGENQAAVLRARRHPHLPVRRTRLARVDHQVCDDTADGLAVKAGLGKLPQVPLQFAVAIRFGIHPIQCFRT